MKDGGPSQTARRVAAHRLDFARVPADYGDPAADQALAADVAAGYRAPASRMHDYLAARTAFFDRTVTGALGRGVRQVVVGAAGYDGRAFRYAKPGVRWFEVDHPATQRDKLRRLERLGIAASHVGFVAADFTRDPAADRLRAAGLDPDAPTLFLLEGIAVYLDPAVLEDVLGQFRQVAGPGSRLAISVSLSRPDGDGARARFQVTVAALGEPARSTFEAGQADLPVLTGTSKEAVRWALGVLIRAELAAEEPDPAASRGQVARLTPRGLDAQRVYHELAGVIERRWRERFRHGVTGALRACLEPLAAGNPPPLLAGLQPYPDNWRASVRLPVTLPHFPMVLHRGGYPDGS